MVHNSCEFCNASFQRAEHLSRHRLRHLGDRPFECPKCDLTFPRRDSMRRHLAQHDRNDPENGHCRTSRVKRACQNCSQLKLRCDGKAPCSRCQLKGSTCSYSPCKIDKVSESRGVKRMTMSRLAGRQSNMPSVDHMGQQGLAFDPENNVASDEAMPPPGICQSRYGAETQTFPPFPSTLFADHTGSQSESSATASIYDLTSTSSHLYGEVPVSAVSVHPQQGNTVVDAPCLEGNARGLQSFEGDLFCTTTPLLAAWTDPQFWAPLYPDQGLEFQQYFATLPADFVQKSPLPFEPDLDQSLSDLPAPAPSFLHARSSPEPPNGHALSSNEFRRKVWDEGRHLRNQNRDSLISNAATGEARRFPIMGYLSPKLSSNGDDNMWESENMAHVKPIPQRTYDHIVDEFKQFNDRPGLYTQFVSGDFPSLAACNAFLQLYFEHCNPLFPFIHQPSFDPAEEQWLLILAIVATGCRFSQVSAGAECADALQEFVRRAFNATIEQYYSSTCEPWLAQVGLLNQIGMQFSGDLRLSELAMSTRSVVATVAQKLNCFAELQRDSNSPEPQQSCVDAWKSWRRAEGIRRVAYTFWLVDSQYALFYDMPQLIPTALLQVRLPCHESLWRAPTATAWSRCMEESGTHQTLSIHQELINLYRSRARRPGLGDFSVLLLVMAVYRSALQVRSSFQESFYLHSGTPEAMESANFRMHPLPDTSVATAKALEYLQILCSDEEEMPRSSSMKSVILHHYHTIGIILRIQLGEIFCYCGYRVTNVEISRSRDRLRAWIQRCGTEARQVAFHAGRLYGQTRQSHMHGHYEGRAFMIACQSLWIYGELAILDLGSPGQKAGNFGTTMGPADNPVVRLDQYLDQQAQQLWVQDGASMRPYVAGVGCILGQRGVARLIQESSRVLCGIRTWGYCEVMGRALRLFHSLRS